MTDWQLFLKKPTITRVATHCIHCGRFANPKNMYFCNACLDDVSLVSNKMLTETLGETFTFPEVTL